MISVLALLVATTGLTAANAQATEYRKIVSCDHDALVIDQIVENRGAFEHFKGYQVVINDPGLANLVLNGVSGFSEEPIASLPAEIKTKYLMELDGGRLVIKNLEGFTKVITGRGHEGFKTFQTHQHNRALGAKSLHFLTADLDAGVNTQKKSLRISLGNALTGGVYDSFSGAFDHSGPNPSAVTLSGPDLHWVVHHCQ